MNSTVLEEDGFFAFSHLSPGNYTIEVKQWGKIVYAKNWDVKKDIDLGEIKVAVEKEIQQVTVTGNKKLIERKVDRMVFNVENSAATTGGDALDVLKIMPRVLVQNDQLSIIGKSSLKVMVNDRLIPLSGDDLVNYLKSISSDNIKNIEVITAPPAKYDAEGNSGLINIVLKTSKKNNWNSYLGGTYKQSKYEFYNENLGFTMNYKKITINSDINFYNGISYAQRDKSFIIFSDENIHSKFYAKSRLKNRFNGNLGMDYQWTKQFSLGFQSIYNTYDVQYRVHLNEYFNKPTSSILTKTYTAGPSSTNNTYVNVHSQYKLDTLGSNIKLNLDYFKNDRKENFILYSKDYEDFEIYVPTQDFSSRDVNNFKIYNYSGSLDGEQHFKQIRLEYGVKASHTKTTNNAGYYTLVSNDPSNQDDTNDSFAYKENLQAVYASGKGKITEKWEIQAGLRLETFQRRIISLLTQEKHTYHSAKLFPGIYLTYNSDENHTLNLTYTRRINRPSYNTLNPFKNRISKGNIISGNPYLNPSYTDNLELNYSWKNNWNTGIYFYRAKDAIDYAYYLNEKEEYIFRKAENCVTENSVGLSQNYTFKTIKWLESYLSLDVYYKENKSKVEGFKSNNIFSANFDINNNLFLNKGKTINLTILYQYALPQYMGTKKISSYSNFGVGIKTMFLDKRLILALNANDIFKTFEAKIKNDFKINKSQDTLYQYAQYIRFTIKYNLGNSTLKSKTLKSGNEEEKNRAIK
ncbi:Outer membrane receptor proteins, mostly Fe transport [Apibacter mensalis]|uniref:Outer membrane receptor proteins, mostly Fe transport n=1 Tax=Apibacter mensalis TaxID=1586267 RepID=A0A0X3ANS7_9FLAO|nr:outer membrane beta-barrel family protein [Apibacter mensalis]CVK16014.1 Outer membrane receptor proteins, mostly Fe transport [Apibacter mensalis]